jgi:hypothetical protein
VDNLPEYLAGDFQLRLCTLLGKHDLRPHRAFVRHRPPIGLCLTTFRKKVEEEKKRLEERKCTKTINIGFF